MIKNVIKGNEPAEDKVVEYWLEIASDGHLLLNARDRQGERKCLLSINKQGQMSLMPHIGGILGLHIDKDSYLHVDRGSFFGL